MQAITSKNFMNSDRQGYWGGKMIVCQPGIMENADDRIIPRKKPISAKGIAKMVWENFIRLKYLRIVVKEMMSYE